jgi:anti-sigma factor RsiW
VRCSSCEILLDRYVEGTLSPREMAHVSAHLRTCAHCRPLLMELRVVDALLATTKSVELAPNFTFAVMAEVRTAPIAATRALSVWAVLAFYVIAAWIVFAALHFGFGARFPHIDLGAAAATLTATWAVVKPIFPATPFVVGILVVDGLLLATALFLYRAAHRRLTHPPEAA